MEQTQPDTHTITETPAQVASEIDGWCVRQMTKLSAEMYPYINRGGDLDDPKYQRKLGQHWAFHRLRSYLHGMRAILQDQPQ